MGQKTNVKIENKHALAVTSTKFQQLLNNPIALATRSKVVKAQASKP